MIDPREQIDHPISIGQYYTDSRTDDSLQLRYLDDAVALLRDTDGHSRLEPVKQFTKNVGAGRYSLDSDGEVDGAYISPESSSEQSDNSSEICEDVDHETVEFEEVDAVGEKAASELRKAGYTTKRDIRRASDEELTDVSYIGETNCQNIRDFIDD